MNKFEFFSLNDFSVWISETIGREERGMVSYKVFLLSKSQFKAVENSSPRKPKLGSKIRWER
jgi:hypothetical protein